MRHISFVMGMPHMLAERHMDSWPRWWAIESENKLPRRPCCLSPRLVASRLVSPLLPSSRLCKLSRLTRFSFFISFVENVMFFFCLFSVSRKFHSSENWVRAVRHRMDRWVSLWRFVSTQQQSVCVCASAVRVYVCVLHVADEDEQNIEKISK